MSHDGVGPRAVMRSAAFLSAGVLAVSVLAGCSGEGDEAGRPVAGQDIAPAGRSLVADGGTLRWAVDAVPETLNTFQSDADAATNRVAGAVLPSMFRLDANGRPVPNPDYLEKAQVVDTEPKQVVLYKLNQQAVWSDGREIGAADFAAQWRALSGKDSAYWTARNAGYDRIEKIQRGRNDLEVKVTFSRPYADWKSLFSPLYPKDVMGTPDSFNDGARRKLKVTAGPFALKKVDHADGDVTLVRNPRWWGRTAKLSEIVLHAVPREKRAAALADGTVDLADIDPAEARGLKSRAFVVRKSLEPAYTQLALNGSDGPLADERVRRAVARAIDRTALARLVLKPLGLPAVPVGSHLALSGQAAYADNSGALGGQDPKEARALLADAGWVPGGKLTEDKRKKTAGSKADKDSTKGSAKDSAEDGDSGTYIVGEDNDNKAHHRRSKSHKHSEDKSHDHKQSGHHTRADDQAGKPLDGKQYLHDHGPRQGGAPGAYAPKGTAAPGGAATGVLAKDGKPLALRFVLPSGAGSESLRVVGERIAGMLEQVGIQTKISKVADAGYFKDHIASGEYDLALYSWPATAYPATDARPVYAKPVPAADGSLTVEQNYTRVGTDQVDQLFDRASVTLDSGEEAALVRKADARIWATAGSVPLYQRPQLVAARTTLVNGGAFGFQTPVYEDMGFLKKGAVLPSASASVH
jgi:peptide/nickel transport system substrate-binding protein